jgi:hypothetical protein
MIKIIKRIIVVIVFPILFSIAVVTMFLSFPIWVFTGKGILNPTCDYMLLKTILFLED